MRFGIVICLLSTLAAGAASAETRVEAQDRTLVVSADGRAAGRLELPVAPRQVLLRGNVACVALGTAGLWIVDVARPDLPTVASRLAVGQEIVGVVPLQGTQVGAVDSAGAMIVFDLANPAAPATLSGMTPTNRTPFAELPPIPPPSAPAPAPLPAPAPVPTPAAAPEPAAPPAPRTPVTALPGRLYNGPAYYVPAPPPPPPVAGKVLRVVQGSAVLDKGLEDGLVLGQHVEIISQVPVERPNPTTGVMQTAPSNESVAVVQIRELAPHGAVAELNRSDSVHDGDKFLVTSLPITERLTFPHRAPYTQRFSAIVRPFIEVGQLGIGFLTDIRYSYHFEAPVSIDLEGAPIAFEIRSGSNQAAPLSLGLTANYDTDYYAIGLGVGMLTYTQLPFQSASDNNNTTTSASGTTPLAASSPSTYAARAAMFLHVRLGSIDGLNLDVRNILVIREDVQGGPQTFHWSGLEAIGYIPLNKRLTLQMGGGGADNGWAYAELGIRTYFVGNGGPGTIIVPICVGFGEFGGASVIETQESGGTAAGPMASIGVEMRW